MKKTRNAISFLILIIICTNNVGYAGNIKKCQTTFKLSGDTLILVTEKKKGFSSLERYFNGWNKISKHPQSAWRDINMEYKGVPDSLKKLIISKNPVDWSQFVYQSNKNGQLREEVFLDCVKKWPLDTSLFILNEKEINCFFSIAIGQNSKDEWVYVMDKNGNNDFSDDKLKKFELIKNFYQNDSEDILKNAITFEYEFYDGKDIKRDSSWLFANSLNSYLFCEYRTCSIELDGNSFEIQMTSKPNSLQYGNFSMLGITKVNGEQQGIIKRKEQLKIKEYLNFNNQYYKIDNVSYYGDTIKLYKVPDIIATGGIQVGMPAINFPFKTLDGKKHKLSDFKGKYVLLDFWGTWCVPCLKELVTLKKAYDLFGDENFEIIGLALDKEENLTKFLEENPLPWIQVPQYRNVNDSIVKMFGISAFPTTFLIDPSGKIINKNLRGEFTINKLEHLFYSTKKLKKIALSGNIKFEYKTDLKRNYNEIYVHILSEDNPGEEYKIPLYYIKDRLMCSVDLKPGNYIYEFSFDGTRIHDVKNEEYKQSQTGDRKVSILRVND